MEAGVRTPQPLTLIWLDFLGGFVLQRGFGGVKLPRLKLAKIMLEI